MTPDAPRDATHPFEAAGAADLYDQQLAFVPAYGRELLVWLESQAGERILDLGCGTGALTAAMAAQGADVLGLDASAEMVRRARVRHPGLTFLVGDARRLDLEDATFDAVFSNAALHWIPAAEAVLREIHRVLKPGGRLVAELGARGNVARVIAVVEEVLKEASYPAPGHPWFFPSRPAYAGLLTAAGLTAVQAETFDRPTPLGQEAMRAWLDVFGAPLLAGVPREEAGAVQDAILARLRDPHGPDGRWTVDYRRLRVLARKPVD